MIMLWDASLLDEQTRKCLDEKKNDINQCDGENDGDISGREADDRRDRARCTNDV